MSDPAPLGFPYAIGEAVMAALTGDAALAGCALRANPEKPADIADGRRLLVFKDAADALKDQSGNAADRTYTFQAGALARTKDARAQAHTDYRAAKRAIRAAVTAMAQGGVNVRGQVRETNVSFQLENIDVGGCLVLGTFAVDYRDLNGF